MGVKPAPHNVGSMKKYAAF